MIFEDSVIALQPELKRYAFTLVKDSDLAADLVQDTIYKSLKYRNKWDINTNLKAWLFTILKNTFINDYRRIKKGCVDNYEDLFILNTIKEDGVNTPESAYSEKEILHNIDQLRDRYKVAFKMFIEGYKYEEIAEKLNVPCGTIKSRIFIARKILIGNLTDNQKIKAMNDIAKQNISDKLTESLQKEGLSKNQAGPLLGVKSPYLSLVTTKAHWKGCSEAAWEELLKWVNSGLSIKQYANKNRHVSDPVVSISKEPAAEVRIKVKPEALEKRQKEIAAKEKRATKGELIDMLIEEKGLLQSKIDAVNLLLKHYISE